jgi:hypothetical protein
MFICTVAAVVDGDPIISRLDWIMGMLWMFAALQGMRDLKKKQETRK